jgi:hypothetical protein
MGFWGEGKKTKSLMQLRKELQKAIMDGDEAAEKRIRAEMAKLKQDKSSKKKPLSKKKSMVG